jgi:hypothetical protein
MLSFAAFSAGHPDCTLIKLPLHREQVPWILPQCKKKDSCFRWFTRLPLLRLDAVEFCPLI